MKQNNRPVRFRLPKPKRRAPSMDALAVLSFLNLLAGERNWKLWRPRLSADKACGAVLLPVIEILRAAARNRDGQLFKDIGRALDNTPAGEAVELLHDPARMAFEFERARTKDSPEVYSVGELREIARGFTARKLDDSTLTRKARQAGLLVRPRGRPA